MKELRVTPEVINDLVKNQIFVFGSNESGIHGAGAARLAVDKFGAQPGKGWGLSGNTFALPTKDWEIKTLPIEAVKNYVDRFIALTNGHYHSKWNFLVTKIGCGLAGFTPEEIAPLFKECRNQRNIWLPQDFHDVLDGIYVPSAEIPLDLIPSVSGGLILTGFKPQKDILNN